MLNNHTGQLIFITKNITIEILTTKISASLLSCHLNGGEHSIASQIDTIAVKEIQK
jgi:hypothetical protein